MRKIVSLISLASVILFMSCSNEESMDLATPSVGELKAVITFEGTESPLRAGSTAIPVTSWSNINTLQLFLYKADGTIAFSAEIDHASVAGSPKEFKWANVPQGQYTLALVANVDSRAQNVTTSVDGGATPAWLNPALVKGKAVNSQVFIDLKGTTLPAAPHIFDITRRGFSPAAEIFTAYNSNVTITEGQTTTLSGANSLKLKREVSLMRLRIDKTNKTSAPNLSEVSFANINNFVAVQKLPVGIGLKLDTFEGGIYATASDEDRIIIGASGTSAYNTIDPVSGYLPNQILGGDFTLWQEVRVFPNCTRAEAATIISDPDLSKRDLAPSARRYTVTISGWVQSGYKYADGTTAQTAQPVYWSGTVLGAFFPNVIREVNLNITTSGLPAIPDPEQVGGLTINVEAPLPWDSNIQSETIEI